jgi:DNA-binding XRE family transcriptional regulator
MTGIRIFSDLRARMSPEGRARAEAHTAALAPEMDLAELRRAHALSQETLAETLHIGQAAVAKIEKRTDMYVSTLRRFVEAMGGELEITARFPDHAVRIRSFGEQQVQPDGRARISADERISFRRRQRRQGSEV